MRMSNTFKSILVLLLVLFLATGYTVASSANNAPTEKVIIGFKGKPDASLVKAHGGEIKYQYTILDAIAATVPEKAVNALEKNPSVEYVEKDKKVHIIGETLPWGVDRIDAEVAWGGSEDALSVTENAGTGVDVAVIDTGIDYTHPDLDDRYAKGYDFYNGDSDPLDDHGHGTHVSGIIAAEDNTEGVIGTAPKVNILAAKVLGEDGSGYTSDVAAGIDWAVNNGAEVISMSLGGDGTSTLKESCDNAYAEGVLLVAAAGNDGIAPVSYPARYDSVVAVSATNDNDNLASFSNYGTDIELAAPGVDIYSTMPTYDAYLTSGGPPWTRYSKDYDYLSGTSMACPHVSGTAALVFASGVTDSNSDGNVNDEIRGILQDTAEDLGEDGWDQYYGYGLVDAEAAASTVEDTTPPAKVTNLTATAVSSSQIDLTWDANSETDLDHYNIYRDNVKIAESTTNSYSDTGLTPSTTYTYNVSAVDTSGNEGEKSDPASATTLEEDTTPPAKVTNLTATAVSSSQIDLAWDANNEEDLDHYNIYRDGSCIDSTTSTSYSDTGLSPSTTYTYEVSAVDTSGNEGNKSDPVSATTEEGDTMHVQDVNLWLDRTRGPWEDIGVEVTVVDSDGNGLSDVTVDIQLETPEDSILTATVTTDASGVASTIFDKASRTSGEYTGKVIDLTHSSYKWDTSADVETSDTLTTS